MQISVLNVSAIINQIQMICITVLLFQFRNFKIVYRRYAGLYFCICVDISDNNLAYLEAIHNFVEVLNEYFHNVCELDLVFNFYKVCTGKLKNITATLFDINTMPL